MAREHRGRGPGSGGIAAGLMGVWTLAVGAAVLHDAPVLVWSPFGISDDEVLIRIQGGGDRAGAPIVEILASKSLLSEKELAAAESTAMGKCPGPARTGLGAGAVSVRIRVRGASRTGACFDGGNAAVLGFVAERVRKTVDGGRNP